MKRIAISTEQDQVSPHFGRCPSYTMVDFENENVISREIIGNPGHEPGFLPQFLHQEGVNAIVAGGMGPRAQDLFRAVGIDVYLGVEGSVDAVIEQLRKGTLVVGESACSHGQGSEKAECDHHHNG